MEKGSIQKGNKNKSSVNKMNKKHIIYISIDVDEERISSCNGRHINCGHFVKGNLLILIQV